MVEILRCRKHAHLSREAAAFFRKKVEDKPDLTVALPTGRTPSGMYRELRLAHGRGEIDLSRVRAFGIDELVGRAPVGHAYRNYLRLYLYSWAKIPLARRSHLDGTAKDLDGVCASYEEKIREAGGLDLVIMGVGANGHVGYNEPGSSFESRTRVVELTPETVATILSPLPFAGVRLGLTMGLGTILEAREILLLASGPRKRGAMGALFDGPESSGMPVTALRRHPRLAVILDEEADPRG